MMVGFVGGVYGLDLGSLRGRRVGGLCCRGSGFSEGGGGGGHGGGTGGEKRRRLRGLVFGGAAVAAVLVGGPWWGVGGWNVGRWVRALEGEGKGGELVVEKVGGKISQASPPSNSVLEKIQPVPVFAITDQDGRPYLAKVSMAREKREETIPTYESPHCSLSTQQFCQQLYANPHFPLRP